MRTPVFLGGKLPGGGGMIEGWGGFLGLLDFLLALVVSLGEVGARVGPRLWKFSNEKPLVQGQLADQNRQALSCTHFTLGWCV